jgi:queuine tRNA-ribosyltransferase/7-cyano-7-deazaguanine tRNA-ribosyltransferase
MFEFEIKNIYKKARSGFFYTPHGKLETPNLAIVATHGKIKLLNKTDQLRANPDLIIANTFHLFVNGKVAEIKKASGLHKWSSFKKPIMTDSGGFQVLSLGLGRIHKTGKVAKNISIYRNTRQRILASNVQISEDGAVFNFNNKKYKITPETSIKIQQDLRADIIFAFDECTSPFNSYAYTKKAMERTHRWAVRCLKTHNSKLITQALFGIVQGGLFEDLRKKSSKFIGSLPFDGFGIGGSFGEEQMKQAVAWAVSYLPEEKPRHLLGIGKIKDIFIAVKQGIDLFDCPIPTREARHGVLYVKTGKLNIEKGIFTKDRKLIESGCGCWVCRQGITRQEIHHLFKEERLNSVKIRVNPFSNPYKSVSKAKRLATIHNIYFFKNLFEEIREAITDDKLEKLEKEYYNYR